MSRFCLSAAELLNYFHLVQHGNSTTCKLDLGNFYKHCPKILKNNYMLLFAYVFSGEKYAALKAHSYGTTKDAYSTVKTRE